MTIIFLLSLWCEGHLANEAHLFDCCGCETTVGERYKFVNLGYLFFISVNVVVMENGSCHHVLLHVFPGLETERFLSP